MIRRIRQFASVDVSTHGQLVTHENAEWLCEADTLAVSMEGLDQDVYEKYRVGGQWHRAMNALKILAAKRAETGKHIVWTWVVTRDNEHQLEEAKKIAASMGNVFLGDKPPYFTSEENRKSLEPLNPKYHRYHPDGTLKADRFGCHEFWETIYFSPTGDVSTCCYDYNQSWIMGNVGEKSVLEIWNDEPYRAMRRKHLAGTLNVLCETQCGLP
jgi:radical SAM protein with 4Fe4S-binding SPASM domain